MCNLDGEQDSPKILMAQCKVVIYDERWRELEENRDNRKHGDENRKEFYDKECELERKNQRF